jgi:hypothetical protein
MQNQALTALGSIAGRWYVRKAKQASAWREVNMPVACQATKNR